jgi:hypothetical protein
MVINMNAQPYCTVDTATNICDNVVMWDGNPDTWTPPVDHLMLAQSTTPAKVWEYDSVAKTWSLGVQVGAGQIGFTWDGTYLTTNEPQPVTPTQPATTGAQTL